MLIIFDCDGVLVDSEPVANGVLVRYLTELGLPHADGDTDKYVGISIPSMIAKIEREWNTTLPADFREELWRRDRVAFETELRSIAGIAEVLAGLEGPRCVASSSAPERIRNSLTLTGLIGFFEPHIFSASQVENGKPAPDLFLFAAERMGVPAAECLVIEDAVPGVQAGRAAGMRVLGFAGGGHCRPGHAAKLIDAGAERVFDDMSELMDLI